MVQMMNAQLFITNEQDSDARLAVPRPSTGNTQALRVECSDLYHQRTLYNSHN